MKLCISPAAQILVAVGRTPQGLTHGQMKRRGLADYPWNHTKILLDHGFVRRRQIAPYYGDNKAFFITTRGRAVLSSGSEPLVSAQRAIDAAKGVDSLPVPDEQSAFLRMLAFYGATLLEPFQDYEHLHEVRCPAAHLVLVRPSAFRRKRVAFPCPECPGQDSRIRLCLCPGEPGTGASRVTCPGQQDRRADLRCRSCKVPVHDRRTSGMSFMPSPGAVVRLLDGREAVVSNATPLGNDDRVKFGDGHEGNIDAWQIAEVIEENG